MGIEPVMLSLRQAVAVLGADLDCSSDYSIGMPSKLSGVEDWSGAGILVNSS